MLPSGVQSFIPSPSLCVWQVMVDESKAVVAGGTATGQEAALGHDSDDDDDNDDEDSENDSEDGDAHASDGGSKRSAAPPSAAATQGGSEDSEAESRARERVTPAVASAALVAVAGSARQLLPVLFDAFLAAQPSSRPSLQVRHAIPPVSLHALTL